ncbi:MAG TPA: CDP-alcohol phosphatidyltransferase family protein [Flavipsychrobacter sp.]|nr:CDP-alcohol phosphatidyltransferase family protein [Flavipsychrobacter sp.]
MKHLPNLLTLGNLFFGCIAIAFILNAQPFQTVIGGQEYWVMGVQQAYLGSIFIGVAAICDLLDGPTARGLRVFSPIGKDLDSLADLVSFGVAPSMILFKMLWGAYASEPNALDVQMLAMCPAFLVACFAALRLAKFNNTSQEQKSSFQGLPTPAVGLFVASFPLINLYNPYGLGLRLQSIWTLYIIIAILCWLMVSRIRFFKLIPEKWSLKYSWPQIILIIITLAAIPVLQVAAIPLAIILYVLLSLVYKQPEDGTMSKAIS